MKPHRLSIVVPVYFNGMNLPDTVPQLLGLGTQLPRHDLELVFVDDGSADNSVEQLLSFQRTYPEHITVVRLTRNFGSMAAIQAGMIAAKGDVVGMISADLQDPPTLFLEMIEHWERGAKAIFAVRAGREESFSQRVFANTFHWLMGRLALPNYPRGGFDFFLIDRQVVNELNRIREKNTNLMSLIFWLGYPSVQIPYVRRARRVGKSRWTAAKKIKLLIDSMVAFSYVPIRFLSVVGFCMALSAFGYAAFLAYMRSVHRIPVPGFATLGILVAAFSGIQMIMLGLLGEYLWRTLDQTRRRPGFVVDRVYPRSSSTDRERHEPADDGEGDRSAGQAAREFDQRRSTSRSTTPGLELGMSETR